MSYHTVVLDPNIYNYDFFQQDDVCRLCWNRNAITTIMEISSDNIFTMKTDLFDKIIDCFDIDLSRHKRPNRACDECCKQINSFYNFKKFFQETDRRLRQITRKKTEDKQVQTENNYDMMNKNDVMINKADVMMNKNDVMINKNDFMMNKNDDMMNKTDDMINKNDVMINKNDFMINTNDDLINKNDDMMNKTDDMMRINTLEDIFDEFSSDDDDCLSKFKKEVKISSSKRKPKRTPTYCNKCMLECGDVETFNSHNQLHGIDADGLFKCFGCGKKFKTRKTRFCHESNFCKPLKDGYKCDICDRYLPKRGIYEAHMRDHRENVPINLPVDLFKCHKCKKMFRTKENLKSHLECDHEEDKKKFVCDDCGRSFNRRDYLHKHKQTHTGEKQHVCPHCGFRTVQRSSLILHIRKHTGEKPYKCDRCPQRFSSSSNLIVHQRRHLGLKAFECDVCGKKFGYKTTLQEHMTSHAPSKEHICEKCGTTYAHPRGLKRHMIAKHREKIT